MFTHDVEYIIHPRQGPCPLVEPKEPVTLPVEDQLGNVLVEKRVCISASADSKSGSRKSGKYSESWQGVSMPL